MNSQLLQFQSPADFDENIPISISENQKRSVSYALVPKKIEVEVNREQIKFNFKYPINEEESSAYSKNGIAFNLARNTKKLLSVSIKISSSSNLKSKLKDFDTAFRYLRYNEHKEAVKENYDFASNFIHYFVDNVYDPSLLDEIDSNIPE